MTRVKANENVLKEISNYTEEIWESMQEYTEEEKANVNSTMIVALLSDISRSLAIIADAQQAKSWKVEIS